jgi:hypothetical protein
VEFFFEEVGTALGVEEIFGNIATRANFQGDSAALEGGAHGLDALAMGVIESLGNADERGEAAGDALVVIVECRVGGVMAGRLGLAIVIADNSGDKVAIAGFESGDVAIESEVFAVLVVATVADAVTDIVEERTGFQMDAGLWGQVVNRLKLIEQHEA